MREARAGTIDTCACFAFQRQSADGRARTAHRFIAYYRLSVRHPGSPGLGIDVQQRMVHRYIGSSGGALIAEITEIRSARSPARTTFANRPQLAAALDLCRQRSATLIVARLDRLSRSAALVAHLLESDIDLVVAEMPRADLFTLHIYAIVAEQESRWRSERMKSCYAALKARGIPLGSHLKPFARDRAKEAQDRAEALRPLIDRLRAEGYCSIRAITNELNARGVSTVTGKQWSPELLERVLLRLEGRYDRHPVPGRKSIGPARQKRKAQERAESLRSVIEEIRAEGCRTIPAIAEALNRRAIPTVRGAPWSITNTKRLLYRQQGRLR